MSHKRQIAESPWCNWYHCMGNTYGTWLPGDPRGFRTRWHREHVEGDYRNPPPNGTYSDRFQKSRELMSREKVVLNLEQRKRAVEEVVKSFLKWKIELIVVAIDRVHLHALARFPNRNPRHFLGLAKKESSAFMGRDELAPEGGLWAIKSECIPITDRAHFDTVEQYIRRHASKGAAIWSKPVPSFDEIDISVFLFNSPRYLASHCEPLRVEFGAKIISAHHCAASDSALASASAQFQSSFATSQTF